MEELTEQQIEKICKPYEFNAHQRGMLDYIIGNPLKQSKLMSEWDHQLQHKNFSETAQMLWFFRKSAEYHGYDDAEVEKLLDLLGLDETSETNPQEIYDAERGVSCNWIGRSPNQKFDREDMAIYIPSLDTSVKPGILTDVVYTFGKKSLRLPQGAYDGRNLSINDRNNNISCLFVACAPLPYANEDEVWLGFFDPKSCTEEYMQEHARKKLGSRSSQKEIDARVESDKRFVKRLGIIPLENIAEHALTTIKEYAPERYVRFSEAVSRA